LCSHLPCAKPRCITIAYSGCGKLAFYTIFVGDYPSPKRDMLPQLSQLNDYVKILTLLIWVATIKQKAKLAQRKFNATF
jgi:hypothetical protein